MQSEVADARQEVEAAAKKQGAVVNECSESEEKLRHVQHLLSEATQSLENTRKASKNEANALQKMMSERARLEQLQVTAEMDAQRYAEEKVRLSEIHKDILERTSELSKLDAKVRRRTMDLESLTLKAKNAEEELHEVEGELEKVLLDAAAATKKSEEASATSKNALNESKAAMVNAARSMEEASNAKTEAEKLHAQSEEVQAELHSTTKALMRQHRDFLS